jgi:Linalool dehydratase/isomerase
LKKTAGFIVLLALAAGVYYTLPIGLPASDNYFVAPPQRQLQPDEIGQLKAADRDYFVLANSGDDFAGWNTERQSFWKYSIAFASYGLPSAMIIDPDNHETYKVMMDTMIWKMKSRKVWGDFTDRGFGPDPITMQNIMYKGHLNLMYGLYQLATGDMRYAREYTWLTQQIAHEMQMHHEGRYEGVTCEPNAWFVECNTIGMLSLHVYDILYGTRYTENEVQWSLDFIMNKMRDPDSGLFYTAYLPYHDNYRTDIRGYPNAWILTFLHPFLPEEMEQLYPVFKAQLVTSLGPYAAVKYELGGRPEEVAHLFGLWASKEFGDTELFGKLRNTTDKLGGLGYDTATGGLAYDHRDNDMLNAGVVAAKMHLGWRRVLDHPWPHEQQPYPIPNVEGMSWVDLLPMRIYSADRDNGPLPADSLDKRPCPNCYWGDYRSVRMEKLQAGE